MGKPSVKGMGEVKAKAFVEELFDGKKSFNDYVNLFDTPADMLMSVRLCSCHQYDTEELAMLSVQDVNNMLCPF